MKHLLKTGYLNIHPPDNSNVKCAITACQNDSENLYVASYLTNGELTRDTPVRVTRWPMSGVALTKSSIKHQPKKTNELP